MLILLLETEQSSYALDTAKIVEIIPVVHFTKVANAPEFLAGIINYRGKSVPVIDLGLLLDGKACRIRMNTRIILMPIASEEKESPLVGLIAENISSTQRLEWVGEHRNERLFYQLIDQDGKEEGRKFVQLLEIKRFLGQEKLDNLRMYS